MRTEGVTNLTWPEYVRLTFDFYGNKFAYNDESYVNFVFSNLQSFPTIPVMHFSFICTCSVFNQIKMSRELSFSSITHV